MSADNWTVCPRCFHRKQEGVESRKAEVDAAYGKVPVDQFDAMRAEFEKYRDEPMPQNWREDYEIGLYDDGSGAFFVSYSGSCNECGLSHEFKHQEQVMFDA